MGRGLCLGVGLVGVGFLGLARMLSAGVGAANLEPSPTINHQPNQTQQHDRRTTMRTATAAVMTTGGAAAMMAGATLGVATSEWVGTDWG